MVNFYSNLEDGDRKDFALRKAKIDFINNNSRRAHPIYWAAYIPIGNMEVIAIGRDSYWYWYVLGISILGVFGFLFVRWRDSQKN